MLDIQYIYENQEAVKEGLRRRLFSNTDLVDRAVDLEREKKSLLSKVERLRAERNRLAKAGKHIQEGKKIKIELSRIEPKLRQIEQNLKECLFSIPNIPLEDVPAGPEENKKIIRKYGAPPKFTFEPRDHLTLGNMLGIIDVERASKVSGSRFSYLKGDAVLLEFALINFAFEKLTASGFTPILPPMLIKKEITEGLGYWQAGGNENYYFVKDYERKNSGKEERELDLYLVGTSEHSVVPYHAGETLEESELPKKYVAFSSCFRRESGSYGKDTRGILRVHQFNKVEMVVLATPDKSKDVHEEMLSVSEGLMQDLGLPYQVAVLAAGDIGFPTAKTYDIETWMPSEGKYRETHSISTTTDYQSRRLDIRFREKNRTRYVHILNGTVFSERPIIAILENYQQEDGSVVVPQVLRKWVGKDVIKK